MYLRIHKNAQKCNLALQPLSDRMSKGNIYFGSLEEEINEDSTIIQPTTVIHNKLSGGGYNNEQLTRTQSTFNTGNTSNDEFDRRALAKTLKIPTLDTTVRTLLIALNQPVTLFGEGPGERRDRLRVMASKAIISLPGAFELFPCLRGLCGQTAEDTRNLSPNDSDADDDDEEFYVPGSTDLVKVRSFILQDSITRHHPFKFDHVTEISERTALHDKLTKDLDLRWSTVDPNGRPLSTCTFTPDGTLYTGDWSGRLMKYELFDPSSTLVASFTDRITATCSNEDGVLLVGTCTGKISMSRSSTNNNPTTVEIEIPSNHAIKSLNWHTSNRFFASTSSDSLWRLWDAQSATEIQVQEGHLGGVSAGAWHPDGALFCTGGTSDGLIRVWDCRLGKAIWSIPPCNEGQKATVTCLAFSTQISHLLTSSDSDGLLKFHDLRKLQGEYMKTAAHRSCSSGLKFIANGRALVTSGFDGALRIWSPGDLRLVKEVQVSGSKVTALDALEIQNEIKLAAVTFDRNVKIFST